MIRCDNVYLFLAFFFLDTTAAAPPANSSRIPAVTGIIPSVSPVFGRFFLYPSDWFYHWYQGDARLDSFDDSVCLSQVRDF